jgi:hypothetical protein
MKINIEYHPYIKHANQELDWLPMDTEDRYQNNLKTQYHNLEKNGWINSNFTYKFNSYGFRCEEFSNDPSIVFLGCSITIGMGLPEHHTWPSLVAKNLNLKCCNLGIGGSSNDTAFRLAYFWLEKIKPKFVVFCETFPSRMEIFSTNGIVRCMPGIISTPAETVEDFYLGHWTANEHNIHLLRKKNCLAINKLSNNIGAKFIKVNVDQFRYRDRARDLAHPGTESNVDFSKIVMSNI